MVSDEKEVENNITDSRPKTINDLLS